MLCTFFTGKSDSTPQLATSSILLYVVVAIRQMLTFCWRPEQALFCSELCHWCYWGVHINLYTVTLFYGSHCAIVKRLRMILRVAIDSWNPRRLCFLLLASDFGTDTWSKWATSCGTPSPTNLQWAALSVTHRLSKVMSWSWSNPDNLCAWRWGARFGLDSDKGVSLCLLLPMVMRPAGLGGLDTNDCCHPIRVVLKGPIFFSP